MHDEPSSLGHNHERAHYSSDVDHEMTLRWCFIPHAQFLASFFPGSQEVPNGVVESVRAGWQRELEPTLVRKEKESAMYAPLVSATTWTASDATMLTRLAVQMAWTCDPTHGLRR